MQAQADGSKPGPKGKGLFRVVEFTNASGSEAFRVTGWTLDGERVRQNFQDHGAAVARLQELEIQSANLETAARPLVTRLTPEQAAQAEAAFVALDGKAMPEAIRYYLDNYREPIQKITVADAFGKFITECEARNLRPLTIANLKAKSKELRDNHGGRILAEISSDTLSPLIFKPTRGPKARDNSRRALHGFFEWAKKQGYCAENPVSKISPIKADRGEPGILTPEQAAEILEAARNFKEGVLVPYISLALFAGLRPTELARLTWDRINLRSKTITIGSDIAKMRAKRIVEMSDNLREWISPYAEETGPIVGVNFRRDFDAVKEAAGWGGRSKEDKGDTRKPWVQDVMRHTAVSYHLARYEHEGKTAVWAGNSPDMVQRHYRGLVTKGQARRFWQISPPKKGRIIQLKAVGK